MSMDLQTIRDFVLVSLDTDTEEIPNALLDVYVKEGFDRAIGQSDTWSFYAVEDTLNTVADQQAYNFGGSDTDRDPAFPYAYRSITDIREDTWSLRPVPHAQIRAKFRRESPSTSRPWGVSEFGDSFYIWPIPDSAYELTVSGYRSPIDWVATGAGSEPDMPEDYHSLVAYHALARGHAQQGDPEMAGYYHSLFETNVRQMKSRYSTPVIAGPYILNGGTGASLQQQNGIGPPIYDWV